MSVEQVVRRISEVQQKLQTLKTLLVDPDLAEYVQGISKNGAARIAAKTKARVAPKKATPNANGLRSAILDLNFQSQFTVEDVVRLLQQQKFDFEERKPESAVRDSLYVLAKKQKGIRLAKKGRGGSKNFYEKII
jgi:hypothetical protein